MIWFSTGRALINKWAKAGQTRVLAAGSFRKWVKESTVEACLTVVGLLSVVTGITCVMAAFTQTDGVEVEARRAAIALIACWTSTGLTQWIAAVIIAA